jgi:enediyne biosynthesis protein E4
VFYLNNGNATFRDATEESGFLKVKGKGMGVVVADLDNDSWPDVFVANDKTPSYLFHNRTRDYSDALPHVQEVGVEAGVAFNGRGELVAGMGIACGDFDEDGLLDLFVTHYHRESDTLYRNLGHLLFVDATSAVGLGTASLPYLGFGTEFIDFDNDGWLDLVVTNGHVLGPAHWSYAMRPQLHRNTRRGKFVEVTDQAGAHFRQEFVARGLAVADYDADGRVDFAVSNIDGPACVVRNATTNSGHSASIQLVGRQSNRSAINTRVIARIGSRRVTREVVGGGSYQSESAKIITIGLETAESMDALEIRWPSGHVDRVEELAGDRQWLIVEGRGPVTHLPFSPRGD